MDKGAISAQLIADDSSSPRALICGPTSLFVDKLSLFFRSEGVVVIEEKTHCPIPETDYAIYVVRFSHMKSILAASKEVFTKTLFVITDGAEHVREISATIKHFPRVKIIITDEYDVPDLNIDKVFSFFFAGARQQVLTLINQLPFDKQLPKKPSGHAAQASVVHKVDTASSVLSSLFTSKDYSQASKDSTQNTDDDLYEKKTLFSFERPLLVVAFVLLLFVVYPFASLVASSLLAARDLKVAYKSVLSSDTALGQKHLDASVNHIERAQSELRRVTWLFSLSNKEELASFFSRMLSLAYHIANGGRYVVSAATTGYEIPGLITSGGHLAEVFAQTKGSLLLANRSFSIAEAEGKLLLAQYPTKSIGFLSQDKLQKVIDQIGDIRHNTEVGEYLLSMLPEITGLSGKRTYLVLFLNNMELRPGGGFIGSFGLISFNEGMMESLQIEDVYTADGQLKGHVDPPFAIRTFLGQENWFLRDSNWDPDFETSAKQAAWFLEKEMDISVDGVIAIDLTAVSYLLAATGPIDLPDYNQRVTSDNLFTLAQTNAQSDFFPGSTQKRDFLGGLGRAILLRLMEENLDTSQALLLQNVMQMLEEKHALLYFRNARLQELARNLGFGGVMSQVQCVVAACFADYLYLVDANLGVNKANYFVKRAVTNAVHITPKGELFREIVILYRNDSPSDQMFPGGAYQNYLRAFVPFGSSIISVKFNGKEVEKGEKSSFSKTGKPVYFVDQYKDKSVFEIFFKVPAESDGRVHIEYLLPGTLSINEPDGVLYSLTMQKQPGTESELIRSIVEYPPFWQAFAGDEKGAVAGSSTLVKDGRLEYNDRLYQDLRFEFRFAKL